jgi:hypothetical protein
MKQKIERFSKLAMLIIIAALFQGFSKKPGGDFYRIFLNDKLMVEQFLTEPKGSPQLSLGTATTNDQLFIHFSHCGIAGKDRTITLTDEKGKQIKVWRFTNSKSTVMQLAVKEIMNASGKTGTGSIYYASKEKAATQFLAKIELKKPVLAKL